MGQTPASADLDDLEDIAYGDQEALGAAVRHAWYHLPGCERYSLIVPDEGSAERTGKGSGRPALNAPALHLQPNPASEALLIRTDLKEPGVWTIVNIAGTILNSGAWADDDQLRVDVRALPAGLYYFVLTPGAGRPTAAKFSVIH